MLRKLPLGMLLLCAGGVVTVVGIAAYLLDYAALNMVGFFYGIPLFLGGVALKITELKPVPFMAQTTPEVLALREQQATSTQTQILNDVTRYRYGQKAHFDSALNYLGLSPIEKQRPELAAVREESRNGAYTLVLLFDSAYLSFDLWKQRQDKMTNFFGPGVKVELAQPDEDEVEVSIIAAPAIAATVE
ncbi:DUF2854 domain-containing protein [Myxacorys almedinensis]|uniref:DUF2854 domain-containing protein n=1 Tax=Myxacorys almedinensis A TaxID=2690445 RepID=A0A8J7YWH4_9CYAN|nr:DUF2854 domain-containing protein [Myxacorys almedinensis]NDJ15899.1 DUF2854 domain-containing protein [Myxacorys almedinensis A]